MYLNPNNQMITLISLFDYCLLNAIATFNTHRMTVSAPACAQQNCAINTQSQMSNLFQTKLKTVLKTMTRSHVICRTRCGNFHCGCVKLPSTGPRPRRSSIFGKPKKYTMEWIKLRHMSTKKSDHKTAINKWKWRASNRRRRQQRHTKQHQKRRNSGKQATTSSSSSLICSASYIWPASTLSA